MRILPLAIAALIAPAALAQPTPSTTTPGGAGTLTPPLATAPTATDAGAPSGPTDTTTTTVGTGTTTGNDASTDSAGTQPTRKGKRRPH